MEKVNLRKCKDPEGRKKCFGCTGMGYCKVLKNTNQVPCPFCKTANQILREDSSFFTRKDGEV